MFNAMLRFRITVRGFENYIKGTSGLFEYSSFTGG
jgi:hypothetical protein